MAKNRRISVVKSVNEGFFQRSYAAIAYFPKFFQPVTTLIHFWKHAHVFFTPPATCAHLQDFRKVLLHFCYTYEERKVKTNVPC